MFSIWKKQPYVSHNYSRNRNTYVQLPNIFSQYFIEDVMYNIKKNIKSSNNLSLCLHPSLKKNNPVVKYTFSKNWNEYIPEKLNKIDGICRPIIYYVVLSDKQLYFVVICGIIFSFCMAYCIIKKP